MKKGIILFICTVIGWTFHLVPVLAASTSNGDYSTENILGQANSDLRDGNVDMNTVATVIVAMVEVVLGLAGTIAVFSLIYHAIQMQINSGITGDSSGVDKAKK